MSDSYETLQALPVRTLVLDYTNIKNSGTLADNATYTASLPVFAGEAVVDVSFKLLEAANDSGGGSTLNVTAGDGTDVDGYLTAFPVHVDQTEIDVISTLNATYSGAFLNDATTDGVINGKIYTSDDTIDFIFTPSSYSLNELTAGKFLMRVFYRNYV